MSKRLNELAEIVLDRVYTYGYQQRAAEAEQCRADDDLLAVERKLAEVTAERDKLAAEIETLQQEVAAGDKALQILAKDRDHWRESRRVAIEAGDLMKAELERLRAFVDSVRTAYANYEWPGFYERIKDAFAALDTANPAPVTEPMDAEGRE